MKLYMRYPYEVDIYNRWPAICYHKVKETIFYSQLGLIDNGRYIMADKEELFVMLVRFLQFLFRQSSRN